MTLEEAIKKVIKAYFEEDEEVAGLTEITTKPTKYTKQYFDEQEKHFLGDKKDTKIEK